MKLRSLLAGHRRAVIALIVLGVVQAAASAGQVVLTKTSIDALTDGAEGLLPRVVGLGAALVLGAAARERERVNADRLGHRIVDSLRGRVFGHLLALDVPQLERMGRGGTLLRLTGDLEALRRFLGGGLVRLPILALTLLTTLVALAWYSPALSLVVATALGAGALASLAIGPHLERSLRKQRRIRSRLTGWMVHRLGAMREIHAAGRESRELSTLKRKSSALADAGGERAARTAAIRFIAQTATGAGVVSAFLVGGRGGDGAGLGEVVASLTVLGFLSTPVAQLGRAFVGWQAARITLEKLRDAMERRRQTAPTLQAASCGTNELVLDDLHVGPLEGFSARVPRGSVIAVTGPNGVGKSQLLSAIAGLNPPRAGGAQVAGRSVYGRSPEERRERVGYARADARLVPGSLSKNLRYRRRRASAEDLERMIRLVGLGGLVGRLPEGLDTRIGTGGASLSDGERGRVTLAQALLGRPELLVLDEVEAHLDEAGRKALAGWIRGYPGWVVLATHDRELAAAADVRWELGEAAGRRPRRSSAGYLAAAATLVLVSGARLDAQAAGGEDTADEAWTEVLEGGLESLRLKAGDLELRLGGRFQFDIADFDASGIAIEDDATWRRGRLSLRGRYDDVWRVHAEYDLIGRFPGWRSVWLRHQEGDRRWTFGNQIPPLGLEESESSADVTFMERSLVSALAPGFGVGLAHSYRGDDYGLHVGLFGDPLEVAQRRDSDGVGLVARAHRKFGTNRSGRLHFGASVELRPNQDGSELRFRARPEASLSKPTILDTRDISNVDGLYTVGLEVAGDRGPLSARAEWLQSFVRRSGVDPTFDGGYAQVSWILTGESRLYRSRTGTYTTVVPEGERGAVELAYRVSMLDLEDSGVTGGVGTNHTLGLNWYLSRNLRFSMNYVRSSSEPGKNGNDLDVDILMGRLQLDF